MATLLPKILALPGSRLAGLAVASVVALVTGCGGPSLEPIPAELIGTWVTDEPRHADRTLTIRSDALVFGTSTLGGDRHTVLGAERTDPFDGFTAYRVSFREVDAEVSQLEVGIREGDTPELRFRNRPEIWRPEGSFSESAGAARRAERAPSNAWGERRKRHG